MVCGSVAILSNQFIKHSNQARWVVSITCVDICALNRKILHVMQASCLFDLQPVPPFYVQYAHEHSNIPQ